MNDVCDRLLIVDDERLHLNVLNDMLKDKYLIKVAVNGEEAIERAISEPRPDLILLDIQMPQMDGYEVLKQLRGDLRTHDIPVIFLTSLNAEEDEVKGLEAGAADYITKPFSPTVVHARIQTQLSLRRTDRKMREAQSQANTLRQQVGALSRGLNSDELSHPEAFKEIITASPSMKALFHYMEAIADSGEAALISGETGVGKELIAQGLHNLSRREGKMLSVNLAGLDDATFSDTLFGHRRGAFTGADQDRMGFIAQAEGGTLFLDEIGDLEISSQIKLLRLLQEKVYYPLGSDEPKAMNATIVAATNRDLQEQMSKGLFRQDLFFRLTAHHIKVPPLRERSEDIPLLMSHFLEEASDAMDKPQLHAPVELLKLLELYPFPGNVRELRAMIFDAVAQHRSGFLISMKSIKQIIDERRGDGIKAVEGAADGADLSFEGNLPTLEEAEYQLIAKAMELADNNQGIAASLLGISRSALNRRLNRRLRELIDQKTPSI